MARPRHIDFYVGNRLRIRRLEVGLSQEALGERLGVTFQQIQKYEKGINSLSAGRLFVVAYYLNVPATYFFEGCTVDGDSVTPPQDEADISALLKNKDTQRMALAFDKIEDTRTRKHFIDLLESIVAKG